MKTNFQITRILIRIPFLLFLLYGTLLSLQAQESLDYYLTDNGVAYNSEIPSPEDFFNQQLGEWHLNYEQVLMYLNELARTSNRAVIKEYARSYENRPLVHIIFTSEENHQNLENLREIHYQFSEPESDIDSGEVPLVVLMGYGVHGNESSATNASVLAAYYLAAAQGDKINTLLDEAIILIDPCLNPDGFTRHSTWANMNQSIVDMPDNHSRQFYEMWPGGRTNHYWFDLNRDYLPLVHPESRGRIEMFHKWKPNIVTDHHEMGPNTTFFFQPGVPSRNNPLTPARNYELTYKIADYHAKYLDRLGAPYFYEESYDDYYLGKGSSYPDVNGSIGILFEQAGFRGRIRETSNGVRKLSYGIRNQFNVSLSTLEAAIDFKEELLDFQKQSVVDAIKQAEQFQTKAYVFGSEHDKVKTLAFVDLLNRHQIDVYHLEDEITRNGKTFSEGSSYVVPAKQKQFRLIKAIFEEVTTFTDSAFYDVSTWHFPYAYNLPFAKISSLNGISISGENVTVQPLTGKLIGERSTLAYLIRWNEYTSPAALYALQNKGLLVKVAKEEFSAETDNQIEPFNRGTILIPVMEQPLSHDEIFLLLSDIAHQTGIDFYGLSTGMSTSGISLGSNNFISLQKPEILMAAGNGINSREAGEIWHLFDQKYKIPVSLTDPSLFASVDMSKYNVIILPGGAFNQWDENTVTKIKQWVHGGGTLIAGPGSIRWVSQNGLSNLEFKAGIKPDTLHYTKYSERTKEISLNAIAGAIVNAEMDLTHPLCYGFTSNEIPVFKTNNVVAEKLPAKYAQPVNLTNEPYLSGFISSQNRDRIKNAPVVSVESVGAGKVISFHENVVFRGMWTGTNKLFANAVFFGQIIR